MVAALAKEFGIERRFLPPDLSNLKRIERLWEFIKRRALFGGRYHPAFAVFQAAINKILDGPSKLFSLMAE